MVKVKTWYSLLMYAQFGQKTKELGPFEIVVAIKSKKRQEETKLLNLVKHFVLSRAFFL
jgi:hypothetical protein